METDIIIIGAGCAGLAAAYELSLVNKKLLVLEAQDRIGGRIHSVKDPRFNQIVEMGAEFIHGELPVTLKFLDKAGIISQPAKGKLWEVENGQIKKTKDFVEGWDRLMKQLERLEKDIPIKEFLDQHFPAEKDKGLRESVLKFVEGYDAADATKASSLALKKEWENEEDQQERINGGYIGLLNFLAGELKSRDNDILLSKTAKTIHWEKGKVEVVTDTNEIFKAAAVLVTLPLGVWQTEGGKGHIAFVPELTEKKQAAKKMGFGAVIKINFQFDNQFWEEETKNKFPDAGFIFSDGDIPTWWTQQPVKNAMLTGWLAGPAAHQLKSATDEEIFEKAIRTLAYVFGETENFIRHRLNFIRHRLIASHITNWTADPFICGAYSYATLDTHWAKNVLARPIETSLYFAGEALYNGTETGTVEGALANGIEVAREMIVDLAVKK